MTLLGSAKGGATVSQTAFTTGTTMPAVPIGQTIIVASTANGAAVTNTVTDPRGNTYTQRATGTYTSNTITNYLHVCKVTTALVAGDVITATFASNRSSASIVAAAFDDVLAATTLTVAAVTALANSTALAVGPSADPADARVLQLVSFGTRGVAQGITWTGPLAAVDMHSPGTGTADRSTGLGYAYVDSPGVLSGAGTLANTDNWIAVESILGVPSVSATAIPDVVMAPPRC